MDSTTNPTPREATCPLPGCGKPLYLIIQSILIVEDTTTPVTDSSVVQSLNDTWDVECENGHRLDSGGVEGDGRRPLLGFRSAMSLGGLR